MHGPALQNPSPLTTYISVLEHALSEAEVREEALVRPHHKRSDRQSGLLSSAELAMGKTPQLALLLLSESVAVCGGHWAGSLLGLAWQHMAQNESAQQKGRRIQA